MNVSSCIDSKCYIIVKDGDVQSDLDTLSLKNREQLEDFHSRILRLQQEIMLSWANFSPTTLLFHYMKVLSNSGKIRDFIVDKMTDIITFFDNYVTFTVYTGRDIHGIYRLLEMIGDPTTLTTLGKRSNHFSPSY